MAIYTNLKFYTMKSTLAIILGFLCIGVYAQKQGNVQRGTQQVSAISTAAQDVRLTNVFANQNTLNPIGTYQFYEGDFSPIYFESYPRFAHDYVAIDFPAFTNVLFLRVLDVSGSVVATYSRWDRTLYIGHLPPGLYQIQVVQRNFMAHASAFYKR